MFSNRAFGWKLAGAVAVAAGFGFLGAAWAGQTLNPAIWRCLAQPERWHGTPVRAGGIARAPNGGAFLLDQGRVRIEVRARQTVREGEKVVVAGTFDREGPHVRASEIRFESPLHPLRWISEAVSLLVLALVAANFLKHFSFHPDTLRAEVRD